MGAAARGILLYGKPLYYMGDLPDSFLPDSDRWIYHVTSQPGYQYGLWHTSCHLYLIAIGYALFGLQDWAARLPGAVCVLLSGAALVGLLRCQSADDQERKGVAGHLCWLYLGSPFIVQQGLMADSDNTIMTTASLFFLHQYLRFRDDWRPAVLLWLALLTCLTFWTKEYAPVYLFASVAVFELLQRRWALLFKAAALLVLGAVLFGVSWWLYCRAFELPAWYPLAFSYQRRLSTGTGSLKEHWNAGGWPQVLWALKVSMAFSLSWNSLFQGLLFLAALGWRAARYLRLRSLQPLDLVASYSLLVLLATKLVRPSQASMKYEYPAYPALLLVLAFLLYQQLGPVRWRALAPVALLTVANLWLFGDPVLRLVHLGMSWKLVGYNAALSALVWLVWRALIRSNWRACLAALACCLLSANLALSWNQRRDYLTTANWNSDYGCRGLSEVTRRLAMSGVAGTYPALPKDVGFQTSLLLNQVDFRWLEVGILGISAEQGPEAFARQLRPDMRRVVVRRRLLSQALGEQLTYRGFQLEAEVGDFLLLRR